MDDDVFEIEAVEDRWYDPRAEYFKVRTPDGKCFLLRCDTTSGEWTLESGFDGAALYARPSITLVTVEPSAIREAEQRIAGCEQCRGEEADRPFDFVLADVLGKHGAFEFILAEIVHCPNCNADLSEETLVEPRGGIEVDARVSAGPQ